LNVKANQKYKQTHREIMDTLLKLLEEKNINRVTVSEICRSVGINRSTFYEHFLDVYDVLEKIADEIGNEAHKLAPKKRPSRSDFTALCGHIKNHKEFYRLYFKQGLPSSIQSKFFLSSPPPKSDEVKKLRRIADEIQLEYHYSFFRAGIDAIIKKWLDRDCLETPEELFEILRQEYSNAPREEEQ